MLIDWLWNRIVKHSIKHNLISMSSFSRGKYSNEFSRRESMLKKKLSVVFEVNDEEADWQVEDIIEILKCSLDFLEASKTLVGSIV